MIQSKWMLLPTFLLAGCNPALSQTTTSYTAGSGISSNIFQDTTALSAVFHEAKVELRGSLDLESSTLLYSALHSERHVPEFGFGDQRRTAVELGYRINLSQDAQIALKAAASREEKGEVFLALPGALVGYRETNHELDTGIGASVAMLGGKTSLAASYGAIHRGDARFTLRGITPVRLEAEVDDLNVEASHIRPLLDGEGGLYAQYRQSLVSGHDQRVYARFPAQTLRGSLAFGRKFGANVKLLADIGLMNVFSDSIGDSVRTMRPYLRAEAEWTAPKDLVFAATYKQETTVTAIDDAVAEYVRSWKLSAKKALAQKAALGIAYEQALSEWLFYDYATQTRKWSASISFPVGEKTALAVEYGHLRRSESDDTADFTVNSLAARLGGSF